MFKFYEMHVQNFAHNNVFFYNNAENKHWKTDVSFLQQSW